MGAYANGHLVEPFCSGPTIFKGWFESIVFPSVLPYFLEPFRYLFPGVARHRQS